MSISFRVTGRDAVPVPASHKHTSASGHMPCRRRQLRSVILPHSHTHTHTHALTSRDLVQLASDCVRTRPLAALAHLLTVARLEKRFFTGSLSHRHSLTGNGGEKQQQQQRRNESSSHTQQPSAAGESDRRAHKREYRCHCLVRHLTAAQPGCAHAVRPTLLLEPLHSTPVSLSLSPSYTDISLALSSVALATIAVAVLSLGISRSVSVVLLWHSLLFSLSLSLSVSVSHSLRLSPQAALTHTLRVESLPLTRTAAAAAAAAASATAATRSLDGQLAPH